MDTLPVSLTQRRLLSDTAPTGAVTCRVTIDGPLDIAPLRSALAVVVDRHEALRTTFRTIDGRPMQVIDATDVPIADPAPEHEAPLDRAAGPLIRLSVRRIAAERFELTVVMHSLIADARSAAILCSELATVYAARGADPVLPDLPIQYGDFALWQLDRWDGTAGGTDDRYWRGTLAGAPQAIALPADRPRPAVPTGPAGTVEFTIDPSTAGRLRDDGTTLLALYATVLSRLSGSDDLLIGIPVTGRDRPGTEHVIGPFADTLPLRVRTDGHPPFADLVDRVRAATTSAAAHREVPAAHIDAVARPPRLQLRFAVDEAPATIIAGALTFRPVVVGTGRPPADLELIVRDTGEAIDGRLTYDSDQFDPDTATLIVDCLLAAARAVAADPRVRLTDIDLLTAEHRRRVLDEWGTGSALDEPEDLVAMLARALTGAEPAVVSGAVELSRDRVREWSGQIAAALAAAGVGPDASVGLCLPRGAALVPAMLGVWTAGAAYVPLDPGYPAERLRMMVADSGIQVVLTQASLAGLVRGMVGAGVTVVRVDAPDLRGMTPAIPVPVAPEALAYTIFTSGSTGRPKGVAVPRGPVAALLRAFQTTIDLAAADALVAVTTLSFDIAVLELLLPLLVGGRVIVADANTAADGVALRRLLEASAATALQATPATWRMLAAAGGVPPAVRLRLCGGEAVPPDLVDVLTSDGAEAWNVYGPTETTVWSAAGRIWPSPAPVEVGPPIPGTRLLVLDDAFRLVPPGVVGEVYITGAGMTRGYHGRPALTAERFLPDPYAIDPGARMYRTGDLARWRRSGRLDLLGRADHQVKLRGFRIETGEIEAILGQHDSVAHVVVTAYVPPGATHATNLVAYIVPAGGPIDTAVLRTHLRTFVPDYMVPAAFVSLAALPLTPNGKVDRARLPQPEWGDDTAAAYVPPETPVQRRLVEMWSELLPEAKQIGIHDSFFALGGHSLIAIALTTRLHAEYGVKLALLTLFTRPTIGEIATVIESAPRLTVAETGPTVG